MNPHVCRWPLYLASLGLAALAASTARAGWFYDLESPLPDTFHIASNPPSPLFFWSAGGGVLTLYDSSPPASGGAFAAYGIETSQVFTDVTVEGTIMPTGSTDDWVGLFARGTEGGGSYWLGFPYGHSQVPGTLWLGKDLGGPDVFLATSSATVNPSGSYDLRLTIEGNYLTGELFDVGGITPLLTVTATDFNAGGVAPFAEGSSGVFVITGDESTTPLYATFDNVRSTPEPSALLLAATATMVLLAAGWWRRRRNA